MVLIDNEEVLRKYIPNVIAPVKGEIPLFERISPYLDSASSWAELNIVGNACMGSLAYGKYPSEMVPVVRQMIVAEALSHALPSLDVVFTPNGLGVINSGNIVPASSDRTTRLIKSMIEVRDSCIESTINYYGDNDSSWRTSEAGKFFGSSLFPTFELVNAIDPFTDKKWNRYKELRLQAIDVENSIADEWVSQELMTYLRGVALTRVTSDVWAVINRLKQQVISVLKGKPISTRAMMDIVNIIRNNPALYPQWHSSETARLFSPPVFRNEKNSSGYFF